MFGMKIDESSEGLYLQLNQVVDGLQSIIVLKKTPLSCSIRKWLKSLSNESSYSQIKQTHLVFAAAVPVQLNLLSLW